MPDSPSNSDIINVLHEHDVRLVRLEGEVTSIQRDVTHQGTRMDRAAERLEQLAEAVARLDGTQKMIFWIVATLLPLIASLELWDRLFK